jgi:hypothetical protein
MGTETICVKNYEEKQIHLIPQLRFQDIAPEWAARER